MSDRGRSIAPLSGALGSAELGEGRYLVGLAGNAADGDHPQAVRARVDLALRTCRYPYQRVGHQVDPLALDVDVARAGQRHVDLLLAVLGVVVLRVVLVVGRQLDDLDADRGHAQLGPGLDETASVGSLHV